MRWSKLVKAMTLSLALAATALAAPQLDKPAQAGAIVSRFESGDVVKLKTFWGGGFVANFGESNGSTIPGLQARVHWNFSWDSPNRFYVTANTFHHGGYVWHQLKNQYSGKCMAAQTVTDYATVTQEDCNSWDTTQFWSGEWWPGYSTVWIMNLAHRHAGLNTILSQKLYETVGSPIWMRTNVNDRSRQEWEVHSCFWSGVVQKDC